MNYKEVGRLGGLQKGLNYKLKKEVARNLYVYTKLTQQEIAKKLEVSQSFVSSSIKEVKTSVKRVEERDLEDNEVNKIIGITELLWKE